MEQKIQKNIKEELLIMCRAFQIQLEIIDRKSQEIAELKNQILYLQSMLDDKCSIIDFLMESRMNKKS